MNSANPADRYIARIRKGYANQAWGTLTRRPEMLTRQSERNCVECGSPIPVERLVLLPDTWTCVRHSGEVKKTEADIELDGADLFDAVKSSQSLGDT